MALGSVAVAGFAAVPAAASSGSGSSNTREISASGTSSFPASALGDAGVQNPEIAAGTVDAGSGITGPASVPTLSVDRSQTAGKSAHGNSASESKKEGSNPQLLASFDGLNHFAQRNANGGKQFSLEPPDQGLCAGNGLVLETVNDVMAVYDSSGNKLEGPVDLNTFYGYIPAIDRAARVRGPFITDPSCYFDVATQRWFHVVLTLDVDPNTGAFLGPNHLDLAVSQSADPLGTWNIYKIPVQDDGTAGTPNHGCTLNGPDSGIGPCLGDYPHIGADANGFYITTNEYSFFGPEFKAAQVYALSKQTLAAGSPNVSVTQIDTTNMVRGKQAGFTVWPAEVPNGQFDASRDGTEFFMSSNAADEVNPLQNRTSNDLIVWALTNTRSLNSDHPDISLTNTAVRVGIYAAPPLSNQKVGPTPLRDCINDTTVPVGGKLGCWRLLLGREPAHNEVESVIDSNDTRMQQVMFADGMLFGALDTALKINGRTQAGIEWFAVRPHLTSDRVHAQVAHQGYVGMADINLTYPALGVNENGVGAMAFTLLGTNDFPSAAYASFDAKSGVGSIHVAAAGVGPDDGFTGYAAFVGSPPRTRWGDYGAAVVDGSKIWIASEYIGQTCTFAQWLADMTCGGTRTAFANWDTRITKLAIGGEE
ncbi:MAG: hypothetical protein ACYDA0_07990 [Candidatus Dormibacteraceae bacterium]